MVSVCIIFIPGILFFWGASLTSAVNTSVLMLSEIIFTLIFTPFFGEKNTIEKYLGSLGIMIGAALVLYKGGWFTFCFGDFLVAISTITFPIEIFSKRSLYIVSPSVVITMRYLMGGVMLLIVSFIFEPIRLIPSIFADNWIMLFLTGFVLLALCKIAFYEGMKRLDISKVISLEMTYPFFSLLTLIFVFNETLYLFQILGVFIMVLGSFYTVKRKSVTGMTMKYVPKNMRES
ncbi:MAG: DMT family transporter [Bacteroidales bacterium]|nr:DMT family transporter [Bacteroidales bacterium]